MSDIYKGELQDYQGNTVYPHTEADVVFCTDGGNVQERLVEHDTKLNETTNSLEVNNKDIIPDSRATYKLAQKLGNCEFSVQGDGAYVTYTPAGGADPVTKKLGDSLTYLGETTSTIDVKKFVDNWNELSSDNFLVIPQSTSASQTYNPGVAANGGNYLSVSCSFSLSKEYDVASGILTVSARVTGHMQEGATGGTALAICICDVYLHLF